ncbi:MAG: uroporphyrinogen-III C-methyltransferase [Fibrobacter sp.]|nr:uroporphyrinogen-III C-methyltransferase [Fibrobacter sp.]
MSGKVYLIGAGPGDPGLLTLRGKEILGRADVVVYDRLVSPAILGMCNPCAKMVDVGKMPQHHKVKQSEINKLLVQFAKENPSGTIARLKGGDPFVFGRGGEEALELVAAGVEFEVVPGVTSAISVPAYAGIPVSHRGIATSFHIITGHEKDVIASEQSERGNLSLDFEALARCPGTLIFLMGIANMEFIAKRLMECGKDPKTPLAFIEKGTTPYQRTVMATLMTAGETIVRENVTAPAITIMGGVVELGKTLAWKKNLPLSGKRLVVTRAAKQSSGITARLNALGAEVIETPMIETRPVDVKGWQDLANFDILAFTSTNGVESFFNQLFDSGYDVRVLAGKKIASVGKITEKKLLEYGIRCDYVPEDHTGEGLGKLLAKTSSESRILLLQGNLADDTLPKLLPNATRWVVYETLPVSELPEWKREAVASADAVVFASTSAVENFVKVMPQSTEGGAEPRISFCIGRMTETAARNHGFEAVTSDETTMDSLVKKIVEYYAP